MRFRPIISLLLLASALALWEFTPLREFLDRDSLMDAAAVVQQQPYPELAVLLAFLGGCVVLIPITALLVVCGLALPPLNAIITALLGVGLGGCIGFALGRWLGSDRVRAYVGPLYDKVSPHLEGRPLLSVLVVRHLPLGPFTMVNIILGSTRIPTTSFLAGNLLSLGPTTVVGVLLGSSITSGSSLPVALSGGIAVLIGLAVFYFARSPRNNRHSTQL